MPVNSKGALKKAAAALLGVTVAGTLAAASVMSASAESNYAGYIKYLDESGNEITVSYDTMADVINAATGFGSKEITIGLNCDWDTKSYGRIIVPDGSKWILDLNGHMINRGLANAKYIGTGEGEVFHVYGNASFTINGGDESTSHAGRVATGSTLGEIWLAGSSDESLTSCPIPGGLITGGACDDDAGAGCICVEGSNTSVTLNDVTLAGNLSDNYGAFVHGNGGAIGVRYGSGNTVTLDNADLLYNHAESEGGAIYATSSSCSINILNESNISSNSAAGARTDIGRGGGGAINIASSNKLTVDGRSCISNNSTRGWGGAIQATSDSTVTIKGDSELASNYAENSGGAICTYYDGTKVTIDGGVLYNNTAKEDGGAIYALAQADINVINGASITGNTAGGNGGAIASADAGTNICIYGKNSEDACTTVTQNVANGNGGAVYVGQDDTMVGIYTDAIVKGNRANGDGGGIYQAGKAGTLFVTSGAELSANIAGGNGGGLCSMGNDTSFRVSNATMEQNEAAEGGAIYTASNTGVYFNGATLSSNKAATGNGGVISINEVMDNDVKFNNTKVTGNKAAKSGGVAFVADAADFDFINGTVVSDNKALNGSGGAVFSGAPCKLVLENSTVAANTATSEGGFTYNATTANIKLREGSQVTGNSAPKGGALSLSQGGTVVIDGGSSLSNNMATGGNGGAINTVGRVTVEIDDSSSMDSNSAEYGDGGAVYAASGASIKATGASTLSGNLAGNRGGTAYLSGDTSFISLRGGSKMADDTAGISGGAVAATADVDVIANNSTISGCKAKVDGGGALYATGCNATIALENGSTISSCTVPSANGKGGAAYQSGGSLAVKSSDGTGKFENCNAGLRGGAVCVDGAASCELSSIEVSACESGSYGGAVCIDGQAACTITGAAIKGCSSKQGSAISYTGTLALESSTLTGNKASSPAGGAVCSADEEGATPSLALGGVMVVRDNTDSTSAMSNVVLKGEEKLALISGDTLDKGTKVYVTVADYSGEGYRQLSADEAFASAAASALLASDATTYSVGYISGDDPQLYLRPYTAGALLGSDGNLYEDLLDAVTGVPDGGSITLLENIESRATVAGKSLAINLNGYTLTAPSAEPAITVGEDARVDLSDGSVVAGGSGNAIAVDGGMLIAKDVVASSDSGCALCVSSGAATVSGSESGGKGVTALLATGGSLAIEAGSYSGSVASVVANGGSVNISGGTFEGNLLVQGGEAHVSGGSFDNVSFATYVESGLAAIKRLGGTCDAVDAASALSAAACAVSDPSTGAKVYFEDASEAASYAATVTGAQITQIYIVTFDAANGADKVRAKVEEGAAVAKPADPSCDEHVFTGWQLNGAAYDFTSSVTGDITLVASWAPLECAVHFDSAGGSDVADQTVHYGQCATEPEAPTRAGYRFAAWSLDGEAYSFSNAVTGNITLTAVWIANTYTVSFDSAGGSRVNDQSVRHGQKAVEPEAPTRTGYTFQGWQLNGKDYDFTAPVTGSITLTASWKAEKHIVHFDSAGGTAVADQIVDYGQCAAEPEAPTRIGYKFAAWSLDSEPYSFGNAVTADITLKANWVPAAYTVSFDSTGGSFVADATVRHGATVAEPPAPTRDGYDFAGWRLDGKAYDFATPVTGSITLTAAWDAQAAPDEASDGSGAAPAATVSLAKVTGVKAKAKGKKRVKVTWITAKDGRGGVQIRYSYKKGMKKAKTVTVKKGAVTSKLLKKLKRGKRVFIQVRAYKKVNGQKVYGAWSAKAKVKVK